MSDADAPPGQDGGEAASLGRRGGLSRTPAQQAARLLNMAKARAARWAKHRAKKKPHK